MENKKVTDIVIAREYSEIYEPFTRSKAKNEQKIKRGMLTRLGLNNEEIDMIIDRVDLEFDYGGADGMYDDGPLTPIKLVMHIGNKPQPIIPRRTPIVDPTPEPQIEPEERVESEPEVEKEGKRNPRQTMLQQYYGDRKAESRRVKTFDRFKSHITKKTIDTFDTDGKKRSIEVYTVEDYEGKAEDSDELLLDGYQTRLERLSRAHQGDFSPYKIEYERLKIASRKELLLKYEEMHKLNPDAAEKFKKEAMSIIDSFNEPEYERDVIQALIDQDTEFIETNNYTYNSRQNTAENLKTLGKDGEKAVKAPISDEQEFAQKLGLKAMNTLITIRNYTKAPVNKAVGTYVASPIYRAIMRVTQPKAKEPSNVDGYLITPMEDILATSQKYSRGTFKNKPSHRYYARKDYFIEEEKEALMNQPAGKEPRVTLGALIRLAIVPRVKAIIQYKEGNTAILNAGLYDIEQATAERNLQMQDKKQVIAEYICEIAGYEKEIENLQILLKITKNPIEKEKIEATIKQRQLARAQLEGRLIEAKETEIDSVSTDAVSMSQHDKANKANISTVVRGFKTAARVVAGAYVSKYLYEEVLKKVKTPETARWIEPQQIETQVPGMDRADVGNITLENIYEKGSGTLSYYARNGGNQIEDKTSVFRGLSFEYNGEIFSGSDGKGFDPTELTNVRIDQVIDGNTKLVSIVQEILQDKLGREFSIEEINELIASGQISGFDVWRSVSDTGIPEGWLNASKIVPEIINSGSHTVIKTIPGRWETVAPEEYFEEVLQLNPAALAAEFGLAASEIADLNEFLRFTRSQEDIQMRSTRKLMRMAKENEKVRAERKAKEAERAKLEGTDPQKKKKKLDIQGTSKSDVPTTKIRRTIKSFQRSNKKKFRFYEYESEAMKEATALEAQKRKGVTVFEQFTGSKKADFASGYDENAIGVNSVDKSTNYERD